MFSIQWASQNITKDPTTFISPNVEPVESLFNLDPTLFGAPPEFSYAIQSLKIATDPLNLTQTLGLASTASFSDSSSIFNPKNLYDYFVSYQAQRYDNLMIKFGLTSNAQADAIYKYMKEWVIPKLANFADKGGNKQHKSFARLITYTISKTEANLREFLPEAVHSRYVSAGLINQKKACKDLLSKSIPSKVDVVCSNYDFTTYDASEVWTIAYIEGKTSTTYQNLAAANNLTSDEMNSIMSPSTTGTFGKF